MTRVYVSAEPERLPPEMLEGVVAAIALGNARVPSQFAEFGSTASMLLRNGSSGPSRRAQAWVRAERRASRLPDQAIADDAECGIPCSGEAGAASLPSDEVSSLSG